MSAKLADIKIKADARTAAMWAGCSDKWPEGYSGNLPEYNIHPAIRTAAMWADLDKWPEGYSTNLVDKNIQSNTRNAAMWAAGQCRAGRWPPSGPEKPQDGLSAARGSTEWPCGLTGLRREIKKPPMLREK